jgi:outer membrane lipoprotein SlyB
LLKMQRNGTMANKYLEKLAAHYTVAPHSDHKTQGVKSVSLNEHEMHQYGQAHRDRNTVKGTLGSAAAGLLAGHAIGNGLESSLAKERLISKQ